MAENIPKVLTSQDCLVTLMMAISASDGRILTAELVKIQSAVNHLPIFADYDVDRFTLMSQVVFNLFEKEEGLDMLFGLIRENLPDRLFETAYALCCDVAAADGIIREPELRLLEEMRYELNIDRLHAAAIERGARARHHRASSNAVASVRSRCFGVVASARLESKRRASRARERETGVGDGRSRASTNARWSTRETRS